MKFFLHNYSELNSFPSDTIKGMLVYGYQFNAEHRYVVDASTHELTDLSYARVEIANKARAVNTAASTITYSADNPNFGFVENETVDGLLLFKEGTNDLDSRLLFYWSIPEEQLDGNISYEINFDPAGIMTVIGA